MMTNELADGLGTTLFLAAPAWLVGTTVVAFLLVSVVMILIVLIQRPQGGGLAGAFGSGAGSGQTAFGARTGDALTIATISVFVIYLVVAVGLNYVVKPPPAQAGPQAGAPGAATAPVESPASVPGGATTPPAEAPAQAPPADAPATTPAPAPAPAPAQAPAEQPQGGGN